MKTNNGEKKNSWLMTYLIASFGLISLHVGVIRDIWGMKVPVVKKICLGHYLFDLRQVSWISMQPQFQLSRWWDLLIPPFSLAVLLLTHQWVNKYKKDQEERSRGITGIYGGFCLGICLGSFTIVGTLLGSLEIYVAVSILVVSILSFIINRYGWLQRSPGVIFTAGPRCIIGIIVGTFLVTGSTLGVVWGAIVMPWIIGAIYSGKIIAVLSVLDSRESPRTH